MTLFPNDIWDDEARYARIPPLLRRRSLNLKLEDLLRIPCNESDTPTREADSHTVRAGRTGGERSRRMDRYRSETTQHDTT